MFRTTFIAAPIVCAFALFGAATQEAHSAPSINSSQLQTAPLVDEVRGGGGRIHMGGGGGGGGGRMHMGGGGGRMYMGGGRMGGNRGFVHGYNRGSHNYMRAGAGRGGIDHSFSRRSHRSYAGMTSHGRRNLHGAGGFDRHGFVDHGRHSRHFIKHGRHSRHFIRRHGRHFFFASGVGFWFYDGYYYGDCAWLRQRAIVTGSSYWWHRYNQCSYWY